MHWVVCTHISRHLPKLQTPPTPQVWLHKVIPAQHFLFKHCPKKGLIYQILWKRNFSSPPALNSRQTPLLPERDFTGEFRVKPRMHPQVLDLLWATRPANYNVHCDAIYSPIEFNENVKYQFRLTTGPNSSATSLCSLSCPNAISPGQIERYQAKHCIANAISPEGQMSVALSVSSVQLQVY